MVAGRWELREPIASGGTSTVWRAVDHRLDTPCAAKLLRQRDAGQILRFAREQSRRLVGPHVVAPYAWAADDNAAVIVSELVTGGSLRTLIGDYGGLSDGTVTTILDQLLDALDDVHRAGIVHRDVKPANVLLRATGEGPLDVALTDFGIAIAQSEVRLTQAGMVIGTPGYVPPEVLRGAALPDPAHDLYALGMLAVALVLGHEDGSPLQAADAVHDPHLRHTILAMTQSDPVARPGDVTQARSLLADARRDALPKDRDGEPIAVLEHVFDTAGEQPVITPPAAGTPTMEPASTVIAPAESPTTVESRPTPPAHPDPDPDSTEASRREPARGVARRVLVGGVVTAAVVLGAVLWINLGDEDPLPPLPSPSRSASATDTPVPAHTSTPAGQQQEAGDPCTWQVEGDFAVTADGIQLKCQLTDDGYVWEPA
ncbi:serine/threonine-protein kinase [Tessaracoccus caeni]|uniref:serine/threonine-protein kinase n=1 Tax=Tessaracoccus caeni TaxID=3031239 RepID=UPI0023DA2461|nr:serine/threonine-protein kinase [Tessaracoccus caeni]MDF1489743.1 serine/threonine-protein kinase [Tessaracoccus caeni]